MTGPPQPNLYMLLGGEVLSGKESKRERKRKWELKKNEIWLGEIL